MQQQCGRAPTGGACSSSWRSPWAARPPRPWFSCTALALEQIRRRAIPACPGARAWSRRLRSRSGCCSRAGKLLSWRAFFRVSEILLLLLAGGLLVSRHRKADRAGGAARRWSTALGLHRAARRFGRVGRLRRGAHRLSRAAGAAAGALPCRLSGSLVTVFAARSARRVAPARSTHARGQASHAGPGLLCYGRMAAHATASAIRALQWLRRRRLRVLLIVPATSAAAAG